MASVFNYDPDRRRTASPWLRTAEGSTASNVDDNGNRRTFHAHCALRELGGLSVPRLERLEDYPMLALEPEPELGSVEYKLHLLLRQRQTFISMTQVDPSALANLSGHSKPKLRPNIVTDSAALSSAVGNLGGGGVHPSGSLPYSTSSPHARQQRLVHLTTQLLWRLKQSSPDHAFSSIDSVVPKLPDASVVRLNAPVRPEKLLPGLEGSQGAMYEIGVADDGTFVGLIREEMEESLINLRAMAASLGCTVSIIRAVIVGTCQPAPVSIIEAPSVTYPTGDIHQAALPPPEELYVVEALVLPDMSRFDNAARSEQNRSMDDGERKYKGGVTVEKPHQDTKQLRVSLTGSTTSGKSTLLGTLLASNLDDGRGKSRLNLLKHRHEIASGVTSSVAHELLGYRRSTETVVNYACQNVDTWTDIHDTAEGGRLVLVTDSAGHPRYRRTIVRSLVAWKPHWTLCCIAASYHADDLASLATVKAVTTVNEDGLGPAQMLAISHLELCLRLSLPLVVVITKYDLATKAGLRQTLSYILTILKAAGRVPHLLRPNAPVKSEEELQRVPDHDMHEVRTVIEQMLDDHNLLVPIVLTSAVNGTGITKLHALLRQLPIPGDAHPDEVEEELVVEENEPTKALSAVTRFDIDEVFVKEVPSFEPRSESQSRRAAEDRTFVLSGLVRRGNISIGDVFLLGPFPTDEHWRGVEPRPPLDMRRTASYPVTYHEMAMRRHAKVGVRRRRSSEDITDGDGRPSRIAFADESEIIESPAAHGEDGEEEISGTSEWLTVRVSSVRNLRLPVRTCFAGQCATVGISLTGAAGMSSPRPRKGMVLLRPWPENADVVQSGRWTHESAGASGDVLACNAFSALFPLQDYHAMEPGAQFNVYAGSVRAVAKVVTVGLQDRKKSGRRREQGLTMTDGTGLSGRDDDEGEQEEDEEEEEEEEEEHMFDLDSGPTGITTGDGRRDGQKKRLLEVVFQFLNSREYVEVGDRVFVMPGQASGGTTALNGFVGEVTRVLG